MKDYQFTSTTWREGKRYVARCSELGVASYGPTPEKASHALEEAVTLYISNAKKLGIWEDFKETFQSDQRYLSSFSIPASH